MVDSVPVVSLCNTQAVQEDPALWVRYDCGMPHGDDDEMRGNSMKKIQLYVIVAILNFVSYKAIWKGSYYSDDVSWVNLQSLEKMVIMHSLFMTLKASGWFVPKDIRTGKPKNKKRGRDDMDWVDMHMKKSMRMNFLI